jgi:hypothetical protein
MAFQTRADINQDHKTVLCLFATRAAGKEIVKASVFDASTPLLDSGRPLLTMEVESNGGSEVSPQKMLCAP